ncbi:hypothetical protein [Sharpea azabuensis]|uniref:hypothetical protein n=1 Tax=Sharpea azabuensis TaxID=322505 RepID=UPI0030B90D9D
MKIESRFLKYISFDTQSSEESTTSPSTDKQKVLGEFLAEEMRILKLQDVMQDEYGIVYGTIPGNTDQGDVIGFIAHMDTSPDARSIPRLFVIIMVRSLQSMMKRRCILIQKNIQSSKILFIMTLLRLMVQHC